MRWFAFPSTCMYMKLSYITESREPMKGKAAVLLSVADTVPGNIPPDLCFLQRLLHGCRHALPLFPWVPCPFLSALSLPICFVTSCLFCHFLSVLSDFPTLSVCPRSLMLRQSSYHFLSALSIFPSLAVWFVTSCLLCQSFHHILSALSVFRHILSALHLNTHTPLTQRSRSGLTMPLSRHSVGNYPETSWHATCQETFGRSCLSPLSHCGLSLA